MNSIRIKLFIQFIIYLLSFLSLFLIINSLLVKNYNINYHKKEINSFVKEFDKTYNGIETIDRRALNEYKLKTGRRISIISKDYKLGFDTRFYNLNRKELELRLQLENFVPHRIKNQGETKDKDIIDQPNKMITKNIQEIKTTGYRFSGKTPNGEATIIWIYQLSNREYIQIEISEDIIDDSRSLINNLLTIITIIIAVVTGTLLYSFSGKITAPIIELKEIAIDISKLNFNRKFQENREDELGLLGKNINSMSNNLENAIRDLKNELERKKEIDQIRKNFISSVSHELKTPIGLIRGCSEVLRYNILKDPNKKTEYFKNLIQEADRMDLLVKDMLHISYMESGSFLINKSEFYMDELIEEICAKYDRKFHNKKAIVDKILLENSKIEGDKTRLFQVIINFIENALRHLDRKKHIQIKMEKIESKIIVSIFNSGNKIPKADLDNIWLSFYKTDKAHSRESGNSGLGLAIVKSIIDSHDGEYGVTNEKDGVRFYFTLATINY